ncbi:cytochrome c1 [Polymorphobacter fuscus]|uniref:Cytochrome c1 n=1 Tax=Sandarakinorhabdus fusca TaxID=1439888 RepID=A0A7C9GQK2_9SPHN|nr:cytochrome c1 [Polymorphobacter fuscus]KAB7644107.1 cytochrome c1 [Polymorphobacter fuscus]MQT18492.1 cytochrome c1 [Polymorphobacter fuscus]NJC08387.1 ubiquinol-cytochrome c reductase cytochrome c1 subunit [Polymorphobacter fuscus]
MVRLGALVVGLFFCIAVLWGAVQPREAVAPDPVKEVVQHPEKMVWAHNGIGNLGITGTFDRKQLQRGFQVYREVCSACHSINRVAFRDLAALGFSEAEIKAIAVSYDIPSIDDAGEPTTRKGTPADKFPLVYPNEAAARAAQNGAYPPDLSLMTKAREDGTNYVHSLLLGYRDEVPKTLTAPEGLYYNPWFHSAFIAMPPPLAADEQVTYADGTKGTRAQYAADVSTFLTWTAEPKLEARKSTGVAAVIYLLILTALGYLSYKKVWADVKGDARRKGAHSNVVDKV